jgi:hypothetical protein
MSITHPAVLTAAILLASTAARSDETNRAPICWTAPFPDLAKPHAGFPLLERVEHFDIFRASPQMGVYSHHSQLVHRDGVFYAAWSSQRFGEDGPGQRVLISLSRDGRAWSEAAECFPSRGPVKPADEMGRVLTANGWAQVGGALYGIAEVHDNIGFVSIDGKEMGRERKGRLRRRARKGHGRIARRVSPGGELGPAFWLVPDPPDPLPGFAPLPDAGDPQFSALAQDVAAVLDEPLNMPNWDFRGANQKQGVMADVYVKAIDGHSLCEPSTYRRPDGVLVRVYRDHHPTHRLYASLSRDGGKSWTVPVPTDIPDSPSRTAVGSLPDGTVFLAGNQLSEPLDRAKRPHYTRDPLTLALSADGVTFDRVAAVRSGSPGIRLPGRGKGRGYQYPSTVVVADAIWIMYSVGKEDVAVSRVPLASLPAAAVKHRN